MLTLYDYLPSQNAYKVRLLLSHLGRPYRTEIVSIFEGRGQDPEYLRINPTGAVPAIRTEDGKVLAESLAILTFLAEGSRYLPQDPYQRARALQWMSFENDYLQNSIGSLRFWTLTGKLGRRPPALVEMKRQAALKCLAILERALESQPFLLGDAYTIADMACFAYTHLAEDANLPLTEHPNVVRWLDRVRAQPGFLPQVYPYAVDPHSSAELP
ncbi:MAG TPA: glutathione S-transferase family protein [Steroidobacteraceae bacterium]|nr:glutathione S-transferase family protein [Steroidobacteraceae bacterium]